MKKLLTAVLVLGIAGMALAAESPKPEPTKKEMPPAKKPAAAASSNAKLLNPAALKSTAPESFKARFETTKGDFVITVTRAWAPNGADRFYDLVKNGYYDNVRFFRVIPGFMVQFGINGDPELNKVWKAANIQDDPVKESNKRGYVTYAKSGAPNSRTTQVFINFGDRNTFLDGQGFSPFGQVTEGMDVVDKINSEYGEGAPQGRGPDQGRVQAEGNAYLEKDFPNLDYVKKATIQKGEVEKKAESSK
jgi:cyclophilin family peptidyl-prolyl cis-trans isomerase